VEQNRALMSDRPPPLGDERSTSMSSRPCPPRALKVILLTVARAIRRGSRVEGYSAALLSGIKNVGARFHVAPRQ
jgi:hypothetical protein